MIDLANLFRELWAWSLDKAEPWHNWAAHGLIAAGLGIFIGVIAKAFGASFGVGPWTAASYYVLRESEALMLAWGFPASIDWKDSVLDAGVPVVCSVMVYLVSLLLSYGRNACGSRILDLFSVPRRPLSMNKPSRNLGPKEVVSDASPIHGRRYRGARAS